jgi:hypothetical protein
VRRPDEYVNFNINRANITTAFRKIIMGLLAPFPPLNSTWGRFLLPDVPAL